MRAAGAFPMQMRTCHWMRGKRERATSCNRCLQGEFDAWMKQYPVLILQAQLAPGCCCKHSSAIFKCSHWPWQFALSDWYPSIFIQRPKLQLH